ncbi:MAG: hypothetical protein HQK97_09145, partial [Nitrospirae bacterium]|nr:hypothetical protein [Nitrospirota bacterium]
YNCAMYFYIIYVKENSSVRGLGKSIGGVRHRISRIAENASIYLRLWRLRRVAIFGASKTGQQYLKMCNRIGTQVEFFIDNNPAMQGRQFMGVPVYPPSYLLETASAKNIAVLIASLGRRAEMRSTLEAMNFTGEII